MPHSTRITPKRDWRKYLRAQLRDARVLLQESSLSLSLFLTLILIGTLLFHYFYNYPDTGISPTFSEALYATFSLIFFQPSLTYPSQWYLQILFFVMPILGLALVADGVLRFGTALVNKQERGQKWQVAMASIYHDHVIVCGLGKVGYRVVLELLKFDVDVVAIEYDENGQFVEKVKRLGVPVIIADARRSDNLRKAGIEAADAIVPATNDQLSNLEIALDAREINPQVKVVIRMFDMELARKVEKGFGIHTAFSTSALTAPIFAAAAMRLDVKSSFYVGDQLMNVSEIVVSSNSEMIGWDIARLEREIDLTVLYYRNAEIHDLHPAPELRLNPGDQLLVLATIDTLREINRRNGA